MLASLLVVAVGAVALCAAVLLLGVAPFVVAVDTAERRGFSTVRWGALAGAGIVVALGLVYVLRDSDLPLPVRLLPVVLTWAAPLALSLLDPAQVRLGGRAGAHER